MTSRPAAVLILGLVVVAAYFAPDLNAQGGGFSAEHTVKFLTYNVNQDDWTQQRAQQVAAIIDHQMPDIITLQEVGIERLNVEGPVTSVRSDLEANLSGD